MNKTTEKWGTHTGKYFVYEQTVYNHGARYDYNENGWVFSPDRYFRKVVDSNDADPITEAEARKVVERNGGTNFDKQDTLIILTDDKGDFVG